MVSIVATTKAREFSLDALLKILEIVDMHIFIEDEMCRVISCYTQTRQNIQFKHE